MALYEIVVEQRYDSQQVITRMNYILNVTPAAVTGSFGLVAALGMIAGGGSYPAGTLFEKWREVVTDEVGFVQVVANNVYDPSDFYATPFATGTNGTNSGAGAEPGYVAYAFRTNQVRRDVRRGQRRLVGVSEAAVGDYGVLGEGQQDVNDELAVAFGASQTYDDEGTSLIYQPVIVAKQEYTPTGGTTTAYRYYPTLSEQLDHIAIGTSWQALTTTTTQNSRKRGRGS